MAEDVEINQQMIRQMRRWRMRERCRDVGMDNFLAVKVIVEPEQPE